MDAAQRHAELDRLATEWRSCRKCALAEGRTQVVVGSGSPDADLMFVGEAPGYHEDRQGMPFVGQAGKLLETLLGEIGLTRADVYIANVLKCRPPGNRDPRPEEIDACQGYLFTQVSLIRPRVICTLGNFATKLLTGQATGITRVRGRPQPHRVGEVDLQLYPIYHPAAALYTPAMLATLREDFHRLPDLLSNHTAPPAVPPSAEAAPVESLAAVGASAPEPAQLGLF
ncbi:MAG: uracil-DNA glycosylase [Gaiellales bacterium]